MQRHGLHVSGLATMVLFALAAATSTSLAATLSLSASTNPVKLGEQVTFTFSPKVVATGDSMTFDFGDGTQETVAATTLCGIFGGCGTVTHLFTTRGSFFVQAYGTIASVTYEGSVEITVSAGDDRFVLAAAHATGQNQTVWRTDVELHNPGSGNATVDIALLVRNQQNLEPEKVRVDVPPGNCLRLADVLDDKFSFTGTAALRLTRVSGTVLGTSRTYNVGASGSFGQFVPVLPYSDAIAFGQEGRLIQLSHDPSLTQGFRTNLGLLNPLPSSVTVEVNLLDANAATLGSFQEELQAYEYVQIDKVFERVTTTAVSDGFIIVRTLTPAGVFFTYASVVDNLTGDPTLVPPLILPLE